MHEVVVVGGGPAGCLAAREAARNSARVLLCEEHSKIGVPARCSGLISKTGLDSLGIDYSESILNSVRGVNIYSPLFNTMHIKSSETKAHVLDRTRFDTLCSQEAESEGAEIKLNARIHELPSNSLIIGADGANSFVARTLDFPKITRFVACYQAEFEGLHLSERESVHVFLSNELFPGLFGWVIPVNEEKARVGVGVSIGARISPKTSFNSLLQFPAVRELLGEANEISYHASIIPMEARSQTANERALLVGDAAGQVKATTGGGVVFGCSCAKLAGKLAAQGEHLNYESAWRAEFGNDLELHSKLRALVDSLSDEKLNSYFGLAKRAGAERFLEEHGDMDKPSSMLGALKKLNIPFLDLYTKFFNIAV
ncbi:MAG: NAD(P)/FAD-dependent oxidoreductase [Candidatus Micrarchaeota archaeon]